MVNKKVKILSGLLAVSILGVTCASIGCMKYSRYEAEKDKEEINKIINKINTSTFNEESIHFKKAVDCSNISFSSAKDFLNTIQSLVRIENADILYKSSVYDKSEDMLIDMYESADEHVSIVLNSNGKVESCRLVGIPEYQLSLIKSLVQENNIRIKEISNGLLLENSNVA